MHFFILFPVTFEYSYMEKKSVIINNNEAKYNIFLAIRRGVTIVKSYLFFTTFM